MCAQIPTLVEKAKHAEAGIDQLSEKTQGTVDKVQDQVQQGADQASEKIVPMAADASRTINSVRAPAWRPAWRSWAALLRQAQWGMGMACRHWLAPACRAVRGSRGCTTQAELVPVRSSSSLAGQGRLSSCKALIHTTDSAEPSASCRQQRIWPRRQAPTQTS